MAKPVEFNIYIGNTGNTQRPPKPIVIPARWKPILELAYAYTTNALENKFIDLAILQETVNSHSGAIDKLTDSVAKLTYLDSPDFIDKINEIAGKIDKIDPDLLKEFAYTYTLIHKAETIGFAYSYSQSLYNVGISYSYAYTSSVGDMLQNNINNLTNRIINDYVTYSYADANYASKSDVPTKISELENDAAYITYSALDDYATSQYVDTKISYVSDSIDSKITNIINAAPEALDTLGEIADALGYDPNLAGTLTNHITNVESSLKEQINQRTTYEYVNELYNKTSAQNNDIPIYDESIKQDLINAGQLPDKYIDIPSPESLPMHANNEDTYLKIIFSTLRKLQQEVSRLQRTFDKGIISMVEEHTRMSYINSEYADVPEEEPMWATDPNSLTEISGAEFYTDNAHSLEPTEYVVVGDNKLTINGTAFWADNKLDVTSGEETNFVKNNLDAKQYVYITSSYPNIKIYLSNYDNDENQIVIDLLQLLNKYSVAQNIKNKYNVLLCVSRAVSNELTGKEEYKGNDFIFLSIGDYYEGRTVLDGYYKNESLYQQYSQALLNNNLTPASRKANRYYISRIEFTDLEIYRMTFYSKFQDFSNDVQPIVPDDDDTYSVAHITIRSVKNIEQLKKIKNQLLENELVYNDSNNCIYIIKDNEIKLISGGTPSEDPSDDSTGMERYEILEWLESNGIVGLTRTDTDVFDRLSLNSVGDITFINQLDEKYKFTVDTNGNLKGLKVNDTKFEDLLKSVAGFNVKEDVKLEQFVNTRGFIGTYNEYKKGYKNESGVTSDNKYVYDKDLRLDSDRIKIGNIYAPLADSTVFGCTHGYVELENSSDRDYPLDGFYIHFARRTSYDKPVDEYSLPLSGVIPAGGTYLIRCKKYSDIEQSNTFIDVNSFDIEWVTADSVDDEGNVTKGELLDLSLGIQNTFLLTYGCPGKDRAKTINYKDPDTGTVSPVDNKFSYKTVMLMIGGSTQIPDFFLYHPCYVDSVSIKANINGSDDPKQVEYTWCGWNGNKGLYSNIGKDALYKTTFELDPAKQAYQALYWNKKSASGKDSSRVRSNTATDYQTVYLQNEFIEFPKTDEKYPVAMYTPMASYLHKNVCTDKTKLDMNKPNMVTSAFGINMLTTRCFNWVSAGEFDEYIWIREQGSTDWKMFESYKNRTLSELTHTDVDGKTTILDGYADSVYNTYRGQINGTIIDTPLTYPHRKEFMYITNNTIYARIKGEFPGCKIKYTSHKCILEIVKNPVETKTIYEYVVGRADKNGNPDPAHTSDIMTFTLYPKTYKPRLYQTTDQQGFHWIEYQTWAAAADHINNVINTQCQKEEIIPVVINTGDATQNGTRVNEWLDYYIGGKNLFNHLEQMSIVGNNDLCDNDPTILGTGDDVGKSNGFYHHVFYCYEVDEKLEDNTYVTKLEIHNEPVPEDVTYDEVFDSQKFKYLPIIKGNDNVYRYVPSFYWFGTPDKYTFVMMNSELTYVTCGQWFNKTLENGTLNGLVNNQTVNLYTGWTVSTKKEGENAPIYDDSFKTIYTMLYNVINEHRTNKKANEPSYVKPVLNEGNEIITEEKLPNVKNLIVACHEMPFTVVTNANLKPGTIDKDRSLNGSSLVGSHMNKLNNNDDKSNYWFSRLLEHFGVKFCYGGHKHTYAITNELRENYLYSVKGENDTDIPKSSYANGPMVMPKTLKTDTAIFTAKLNSNAPVGGGVVGSNIQFSNDGELTDVALSKFPLMNIDDDMEWKTETDGEKLEGINKSKDGSTIYPYYGVKLKSNEELGGVIYMMCQATGFKLKSNKELPGPSQRFSFIIPRTKPGDSGDTPSDEQLQPMYTEIHPDKHEAYLLRLKNIHNGKKVLSQTDYSTKAIVPEYLHRNSKTEINMYGEWTTNEELLLNW